jgi:hypothetical protein
LLTSIFKAQALSIKEAILMLKIFKYLRTRDWLLALFSLAFVVAQVWLDLKTPDYMSEITRLVQTPGSDMGDIWIAGGKMRFRRSETAYRHSPCHLPQAGNLYI